MAEAFVAEHRTPTSENVAGPSYQPLLENGRTWVLAKVWGTDTVATLDSAVALTPTDGFAYRRVP